MSKAGTQAMKESRTRFSPAYQGTLKLVLIEQVPLGILAALILDGGSIARMYLCALIVFWPGFAMIIYRRPMAPTETDLFLIKWGTFLLFAVFAAMSAVIVQWQGAI